MFVRRGPPPHLPPGALPEPLGFQARVAFPGSLSPLSILLEGPQARAQGEAGEEREEMKLGEVEKVSLPAPCTPVNTPCAATTCGNGSNHRNRKRLE